MASSTAKRRRRCLWPIQSGGRLWPLPAPSSLLLLLHAGCCSGQLCRSLRTRCPWQPGRCCVASRCDARQSWSSDSRWIRPISQALARARWCLSAVADPWQHWHRRPTIEGGEHVGGHATCESVEREDCERTREGTCGLSQCGLTVRYTLTLAAGARMCSILGTSPSSGCSTCHSVRVEAIRTRLARATWR